ncbi:MAG TPA: hypothetical protein VFR09_08035 [Alphaproteobacteria bacterium]|nr:hypothetical protein [Alphaproteobacteria bacterium]
MSKQQEIQDLFIKHKAVATRRISGDGAEASTARIEMTKHSVLNELARNHDLEGLEKFFELYPNYDLNSLNLARGGYIAPVPLQAALMTEEAPLTVIRFLVEQGANVNIAPEEGSPAPLHLPYLTPEITEYLLEQGANPSQRGSSGTVRESWQKRAEMYAHPPGPEFENLVDVGQYGRNHENAVGVLAVLDRYEEKQTAIRPASAKAVPAAKGPVVK